MDGPRIPTWVFVVYALLFLASIPWFLPSDVGASILVGVPLWVALSFAVSLAIAVFTVFVVRRYWTDDDSENGRLS